MDKKLTNILIAFLVLTVLYHLFYGGLGLAPIDVGLTVGNSPPVIVITSTLPILLTPTEGGVVDAPIEFDVTDDNGVGDIVDGSLILSFTQGATARSISGVGNCVISDAGNTRSYACNVPMQYYDVSGNYELAITIQDVSGAVAGFNDVPPGSLDYSRLVAVSVPGTLNFDPLTLGIPKEEAFTLNNLGNAGAAIPIVTDVIGSDLISLDGNPPLAVGLFSAGGTISQSCAGGADTLPLTAFSQTLPSVSPAVHSDVGTVNTVMYFCAAIPSGTTAGSYQTDTAPLDPWELIFA